MNYFYLYNKGLYHCITCRNFKELQYYQELYKNAHFFLSEKYLGLEITRSKYYEYQKKLIKKHEKYRNKETEKALSVISSKYLLFLKKYPESEEINNSYKIFENVYLKRYELTEQLLYDFQRNIINIQLNKSLNLRASSLNIVLQKINYIKELWFS